MVRNSMIKGRCGWLALSLILAGCGGASDPETPMIAGMWEARDAEGDAWRLDLSGAETVSGTYLLTFAESSLSFSRLGHWTLRLSSGVPATPDRVGNDRGLRRSGGHVSVGKNDFRDGYLYRGVDIPSGFAAGRGDMTVFPGYCGNLTDGWPGCWREKGLEKPSGRSPFTKDISRVRFPPPSSKVSVSCVLSSI